jgi:hypothetical protein
MSNIDALKDNVIFQLENVKGWISVEDYESALIKVKCLVEALEEVISAEKAEQIPIK